MSHFRLKRLIPLCGTLAALFALAGEARALTDIYLAVGSEDSRLAGRDTRDQAGSSVAVGDISGDGVGDILIGAPQSNGLDNSRTTSGEVAVVLGAPDLLKRLDLRNAAHTFYAATANSNLGTAVAVGDLNADGVGDLIMGAPKADTPMQGGAGAVYVFYGGATLTSDTKIDLGNVHADVILTGTEDGGRLGTALAVGDFNGDGRADLAFAGPREGGQFGLLNAGVVYIFFGRPGLGRQLEVFPGIPGYEMTIRGPAPTALAGRSLAAGDVNGDGVDDLLIGTTVNEAFGRLDSGDVYVVFGRPGLAPDTTIDLADPAQVSLRLIGPLSGDQFGHGLGAADINGDGVKDLLIGAPFSPFVPGMQTGRAYAFFGRPFAPGTTIDLRTESADVTLAGPHAAAELGASVTGGDMNDDGIDEWIVGAPRADDFGQAYRILGRQVWSDLGVYANLTQGARLGDRTGDAVAVGDVNGDAVGDLVLASPLFDGVNDDRRDSGAVYVVFGKAGPDSPSPNCVDDDADGFRVQGRTCGPVDCDDTNPSVNPGVEEICNDGLDNNCDGFVDMEGVDEDGDGWPAPTPGTHCVAGDCDDHDPAINPGMQENCTNGKDDNCDGLADQADPQCAIAQENCTNCVDDDGDGLGDLLEESCAANILQIDGVIARRAKKATVTKAIVVKGALFDAPALVDPTGDAASKGLVVGIAFKNGSQLCLPVSAGRRHGKHTLVFKGADRMRTTLSLSGKKRGRIRVNLRVQGSLDLQAQPVTMAVGLFAGANQPPYRGAVELRAQGRNLVSGQAVP